MNIEGKFWFQANWKLIQWMILYMMYNFIYTYMMYNLMMIERENYTYSHGVLRVSFYNLTVVLKLQTEEGWLCMNYM